MSNKVPRPEAQIRRSQMIGTYGPGAIADLPHYAVVMAGLQAWPQPKQLERVDEERLLPRVRKATESPWVEMYLPPQSEEDDGPDEGVSAYLFPQWFIGDYGLSGPALTHLQHKVREKMDPRGNWAGLVRAFTDPKSGGPRIRVRPLVHASSLMKMKYVPENPDKGPKQFPVVPVRFVQACVQGHLEDINWKYFVHHDHKPTGTCPTPFYMIERGFSGELGDLLVVCPCGAHVPMSLATPENNAHAGGPLGTCGGRTPWLGHDRMRDCLHEDKRRPTKLLIRTASNAYFPQIIRAISIPDPQDKLRAAVAALWEMPLQHVNDAATLANFAAIPDVKNLLAAFSEAAVLGEIKRRKGSADAPAPLTLKQAEVDTFMSATDLPSAPLSDTDATFSAQRVELHGARDGVKAVVDRIVLVHRLREVAALVGFTRFDPALPDIEGELDMSVALAPIAEPLKFVPAVETRGEGIFLALKTEAVNQWLAEKAGERQQALEQGHAEWLAANQGASLPFPGAGYYLVHTLAHLLIQAAALSCGYAASAIRERIYVPGEDTPPEKAVYGLLLYTASPDAEGTLGGLVELGKRFGEVLEQALDTARLCSNDPVCASHDAHDVDEERFLHGAACHGCILIAETCCERMNEMLDRALVVPTVVADSAFFD